MKRAALLLVAALLPACAGPRLAPVQVEGRKEEILKQIKQGRADDAWRSYMNLTRDSRVRIYPLVLDSVAKATLVQGLNAKDPATRLRAAEAIGLAERDWAFRQAIERLADADEHVTSAAIDLLAGMGRRGAIVFIAAHLRRGPEEVGRTPTEVEMRAAFAMAALGERSLPIAPAIAGMNSPELPVRSISARALGEIGNLAALPSLRYGLQSDVEWAVQTASAESLFKLGQLSLVDDFALAAARSDVPERVVWAMRMRLERGRGPSVSLILNQATYSPSPEVRAEAAVVLGRLGIGEAIPRLRDMLLHLEPQVKAAAAYALCQMHRWGGLGIIEDATSSPDAAVRAQAIEYLASLRPGRYKAYYERLVGDREPRVRIAALMGLRFFPYNTCIPVLAQRIGDDDQAVQFTAAALVSRRLMEKF